MSRRGFVIAFGLAASGAIHCGGETLHVGDDDRRVEYDDGQLANVDPAAPVDAAAIAKRCAAPATAREPIGDSPHAKLLVGEALLIGRWFLCPGNAASRFTPPAFEFAGNKVYALDDDGTGRFRRGKAESYGTAYSLTYEAFEVAREGGAQFFVSFQRSPLRMIWDDQAGVVVVYVRA